MSSNLKSFCRAHGAAQCLTCLPVQAREVAQSNVSVLRSPMNKTETRYADLLHGLRLAGEIVSYVFGVVTLKLGPDLRYTPDFFVIRKACDCPPDQYGTGANFHQVEFHEVKGGFTREDALVKIKSASQQFPWFSFKLCRYEKGQWSIKEIR